MTFPSFFHLFRGVRLWQIAQNSLPSDFECQTCTWRFAPLSLSVSHTVLLYLLGLCVRAIHLDLLSTRERLIGASTHLSAAAKSNKTEIFIEDFNPN